MSTAPGYPFVALVGQDRARLALILCAICPRLGGVLLRGEKGTAKSTAARGMTELLPTPTVFRTLPLGATEDRLSGGLDLERTLADGRPQPAPGLLAEVHRGVLYVDEVNLLDDHLVDVLLDVAASGVVRLEREGLSVAYPSDFALVATMNPEEGALRPHLLDRFGLCVDVTAEADLRARVTILERRVAYDADPAAFAAVWAARTDDLGRRLRRARLLLPEVRLPGHVAATIAELCTGNQVAGHRADLVLARASSAHAAWSDRTEVGTDDVLAVADLALAHRRRDQAPGPPPPPRTPSSSSEQAESPQQPEKSPAGPSAERTALPAASGSADTDQDAGTPSPPTPDDTAGDGPDDRAEPVVPDDLVLGCGDPFRTRPLRPVEDRRARTGSGRRHRSRSADRRGRYVRSRPATDCHDLALDATLRAAAAHQAGRRVPGSSGLVIRPVDWHRKIRRRRVGTLIMFVVDASGSMGARGRMVASKGAVLSLLLDAYQQRDLVSLVVFRRTDAQVLLPPTASVEVASRLLHQLPVGGRTPLAAGLATAYQVLRPAMVREPDLRPLAILITDGHATAGLHGGPGDLAEACDLAARIATDRRIRWIVVDTEDPTGVRLHHAERIAAALGAPVFGLAELKAIDLVTVVKGHLL